jgi:hypothetical protein
MAARTRSTVSVGTSSGQLITRDTVAIETPALAATVRMVGLGVICNKTPSTGQTIPNEEVTSITLVFPFYEHLKRLQWRKTAIYDVSISKHKTVTPRHDRKSSTRFSGATLLVRRFMGAVCAPSFDANEARP